MTHTSRLRRRPRWRHAISTRVLMLFVGLGMAIAVIFSLGLQRALSGGWEAFARPLVADYLDRLAGDLGSPPDTARADALAKKLPIRIRIDGPVVRHDTDPEAGGFNTEREWRDRRFERDWILERISADGHRVRFAPARIPQGWNTRGIGWITLAALLVMTAAAYAAVRRLLAPLSDISAGVQRFGAGEFGEPITPRRDDELGALAQRINGMAGNLQGMLEAKRALLLAISHELRSPLTRARLNTELLPDSTERQALLRDLGEMGELITQLLEGERLAAGHAALNREPTDLASLAREAAAQAGFAPTLKLEENLPAQSVDATRVRLLLRNLLANAHHHGDALTRPAELFLRRETDGRLALGVRDHGPGVPEAVLQQLGEAFYRPDSARLRASGGLGTSGGVGLGLHLARLVAQAHGGVLRLQNMQPGLEVAMVWRG